MSLPHREPGGSGDVTRDDTIRHVVVFLVIGAVAGWLASWIVGGEGLLTYLLSGVIGSFVGGYLFSALKIRLPISNVWLAQIVTSTVGAVIVVIIARLIAGH
jgi:uncharacterized membrane protein YeaQ/YmgE (transglycosylase-associated protein family)